MKGNYKYLYLLILVSLFVSSCHQKKDSEGAMEKEAPDSRVKYVELTNEQFEYNKMALGAVDSMFFERFVKASGYFRPVKKAVAEISAVFPGMITDVLVEEGDRVQKGKTLFYLTGEEIISLQMEYADAFFNFSQLESDYKRQLKLSEEHVISEKVVEQAESAYRVMESKVIGLAAQLNLLDIDPADVENGEIQRKIAIKAPIRGVVGELSVKIGRHVSSDEVLMQIVDSEQMVLELRVFDSYLKDIAPGQDVRFGSVGDELIGNSAVLKKIGNVVDVETRTVKCRATVNKSELQKFYANQFVDAEIITCTREVLAVPEQALIKEDERNYLLLLDKKEDNTYYFRKQLVEVGTKQKGFVELLSTVNDKFLVNGTDILITE